jgi:putative transposase
MLEYRRHLPHQFPEGAAIFLTWNLKGAIPDEVVERLRRQREQLQREPPRKSESPRDRALRHGKLIFRKADEFLDRTDRGPLYLKESAAAKIVEDAILYGCREQRYELFAWCVMANHVHLLVLPRWKLPKITQGIKGFTAHEINRLRGTAGTFWQDESYDHWARDEDELLRIIAYIENNPGAGRFMCPSGGLALVQRSLPRELASRGAIPLPSRSGFPA